MRPPLIFAVSIRRFRLALILVIALGTLALASSKEARAPGSDEVFPLLGGIVVVDPGHGGIDPGCHLDDVTEKEISLSVALLLAEELSNLGGKVFLTRTADVELSSFGRSMRTRHGRDLEGRVLLAESYKGELLVSLHVNAANSEKMGGGMVFYHPGSFESRKLAASILKHLREVTPGDQNAALPADFFVLRRAAMPAVLVEMGFLTHRQDRAVLVSPQGQKRLAAAIARGIEEYLSVDPPLAQEDRVEAGVPFLHLYGLGTDGAHECPLILSQSQPGSQVGGP